MVLKAFAVYDVKAEAFLQPVFFPALGLFLRAFTDACLDSKHEFGKHPSDYRAAEIGSYDEVNGRLTSLEVPRWLGFASEYCSARDEHGLPRDG